MTWPNYLIIMTWPNYLFFYQFYLAILTWLVWPDLANLINMTSPN